MCVCVWSWKRVSDPLELKLEMVVNHHVGAWTQTWILSARATTAFNHCVISQVLFPLLLGAVSNHVVLADLGLRTCLMLDQVLLELSDPPASAL